MDTTHLLLYTATFAFIITNLYGWVLKWFFHPKAYADDIQRLFPARKSVGALYLMQVFEVPYLIYVGEPDALLFVNAFAMLIFSPQMMVMCDDYFFQGLSRKRSGLWIYVPAAIILVPLLLHVFKIITLPDGYREWTFLAVTIVFFANLWLSVSMALKIGRGIRRVNEAVYADTEDFPVRLAQYIQWLPTTIYLMVAVCFYADNVWVKFTRDVVFTMLNTWFCIFTLNPWRSVLTEQEHDILKQDDASTTFRLSDDRYEDLSARLSHFMKHDRIFTERHICIDTLIKELGTNANYLAEVIKRNGYQSFYDMINRHRVELAVELINQHSDMKLLDIAEQCGFSSQASMNKAFKQVGKPSPSACRKSLESK